MSGETDNGRPLTFCYRCGHLWLPKTDADPKRCPRCHSSRWDVPERRVRSCKFCGTGFQMDSLGDPCPSCGRRQDEPAGSALHCNQCDYDWRPRSSSQPGRCPLCRSSEWNLPKADRLMCQQCGHVWRRQSGHPVKCPRCQSRRWDEPQRAVRCQRCGHVWRLRTRSGEGASICPKCKTTKWDTPMEVSRSSVDGNVHYSRSVAGRTSLTVCQGCGHRRYIGDGAPACPRCGRAPSFRDRVDSTSMTLWSSGGRELVYITENGYGCVYLMEGDMPLACRYINEVLRELGTTMGDIVREVNDGGMTEEFRRLAGDMWSHKDDFERYTDYFMKRLSLDCVDARILAIHFTGMGPEAISRRFSMSEEEVRKAFNRIMEAYSVSGIVVDDTIFTENPFTHY